MSGNRSRGKRKDERGERMRERKEERGRERREKRGEVEKGRRVEQGMWHTKEGRREVREAANR